MRTKQSGFTLIELMMVVAIVAILSAIAYPSYTQHLIKANRSAAESFMQGLANKQEQYMLDARRYAGGGAGGLVELSLGAPADVSGKYDITVTCTMPVAVGNCEQQDGVPTYLITATPKAGTIQAGDKECATLTLDHLGAKGAKDKSDADSSALCWR